MLAVIATIAVGYALASIGQLAWAWDSVDRVTLGNDSRHGGDMPSGAIEDRGAQGDPNVLNATSAPPTVVALIGSDSRSGLADLGDFGDFETTNADVILLAIRKGEDWTLLSVPRDLYVEDLCHGDRHKIGEAFQRCGKTSGLANLVAELEHVTGLRIPHAAAIDLAGFQAVVDVVGGYEICTPYPLRDAKSGLDIEAGCALADGETTLQWLRSRQTEELVDGSWRTERAVSDLTRNRRQREFLIGLLERVSVSATPDTMLELVSRVAPFLTIDDQLSLGDAARWGYQLRSHNLETAEIPVELATSDAGASILVPTVDIVEFVAGLTP